MSEQQPEKTKKERTTRRAGQIVARGEKTFLIRVFLGRDANGKRRYHNHTFRGTKKDAQTWLNGALRRLDLGEPIEQSAMLCSEFFEQWLTTAAKPRVRNRTFELYEQTFKAYILPALGSKQLAEVQSLDLQTLYVNLQKKGLKPQTVRRVHNLLHNSFNQAMRWQLMNQNPATLVDPPRIGKRELKVLDKDSARVFLDAAKPERYAPVFTFLLATGCRPGEAFGLKWSNVDWQAGTITIVRSLYWRPKRQGWELTEPKTTASRRTIPLGKAMMKTLGDWKRRQAEERLKAGSEWQNHDFVFTKLTGAPLDLETLRDRFKVVTKRAGLSGLRLYDLRHTCASILMAEGQNPKVVSERLGHANIALTLGTYSHISKGMQEEASQKLENALFG